VLGGCQGSTGPSSLNPATGRPYGIEFPAVTIRDMVRAQRLLLEGTSASPRIHAVIGGSMGGMQALQWAIEYPRLRPRVLAMATTGRESAQAIAFNEVGRQAIMQDPAWNRGDYPKQGGPRTGLAIARMMAHITYVSDASMDRKFGRRRKERPWRQRRGARVRRAVRGREATCGTRGRASSTGSTRTPTSTSRARSTSSTSPTPPVRWSSAFAPVEAETLVVGFTSDWLFPPEQNRDLALALLRAGKRASYAELTTDLGHDSFLLESGHGADAGV
jgi:homoserine O-acetyltransferase